MFLIPYKYYIFGSCVSLKESMKKTNMVAKFKYVLHWNALSFTAIFFLKKIDRSRELWHYSPCWNYSPNSKSYNQKLLAVNSLINLWRNLLDLSSKLLFNPIPVINISTNKFHNSLIAYKFLVLKTKDEIK